MALSIAKKVNQKDNKNVQKQMSNPAFCKHLPFNAKVSLSVLQFCPIFLKVRKQKF
jgi:hypothetical protein